MGGLERDRGRGTLDWAVTKVCDEVPLSPEPDPVSGQVPSVLPDFAVVVQPAPTVAPPGSPCCQGLLTITRPWQDRNNQNVTAEKGESPPGGAAPPQQPGPLQQLCPWGRGSQRGAQCHVPHQHLTPFFQQWSFPSSGTKELGGDSTSPHPHRLPLAPSPSSQGCIMSQS